MGASNHWRPVALMLAIGAAYDLAFGVAILAFTHPAAAILNLKVPDDPVYLCLNGIFLLLLAGLYTAAAREPERYRLVAPISAMGRVLGFAFFVWAWAGGRPSTFLALGFADLVLGGATLLAWRRASALSD